MNLNIEYLEELLEEKGWSYGQFARNCGLSVATVSRIMSGRRHAGAKTIWAIRGLLKDDLEEPLDKVFFGSNVENGER